MEQETGMHRFSKCYLKLQYILYWIILFLTNPGLLHLYFVYFSCLFSKQRSSGYIKFNIIKLRNNGLMTQIKVNSKNLLHGMPPGVV